MKFFPAFLLAAVAVAQTPSSHLPGTVTAVNSVREPDFRQNRAGRSHVHHDRPHPNSASAGRRLRSQAVAENDASPRSLPDDEVVAYYRGAADQKPLLATSLVVRTKADFGQLAQKQLEDWKKRGHSGTVTAGRPGREDRHHEGRAADRHHASRRQDDDPPIFAGFR